MKRIGIDLGGTFIKAGIVDEKNQIMMSDLRPALTEREPVEIIKDMVQLVTDLAKKADVPMRDIAGIGIGSPGTIDTKKGEVLYSNNFNWKHVPLAELFYDMLMEDMDFPKDLEGSMSAKNGQEVLPVRVSNDANCAALGELVCDEEFSRPSMDQGEGHCDTPTDEKPRGKSAVLLTLGTGVGSGIILNGKLYEGESAGGAELGHMVIRHNGRQCSCGRKGCLEAYVSANALVNEAKKVAEEYEFSILNRLAREEMMTYRKSVEKSANNGTTHKIYNSGNPDEALAFLNGKHVIGAVRSNDAAAVKVFRQYLEYLGCGITNIINIFRPEVIYLGGGICEGFDLMESYLNEYVKKNAFGGEIAKTAVIKKATHGNDAGIIGAAALV